MNIFKLKIKNYKSIKDSGEIEIDNRIMAFIGQNNAGKSAILDAIQCVFPSVKKVVSKSDFHKGTHDNIEITVWFNGLTDDYIEDKLFSDAIFKLVDRARKLEDDNETKAENAWKKVEETREQKLAEAKELYQIADDSMCIKLVITNADKMGTKYYVDADSVKEIKEIELKKILPILKVIPAIRDPKNESTAGANSYLKELISMLDDDMATSISIAGNDTVSYRQLNDIIAEESAKRCKSISSSITEYYNEAIGVNDFEVIVSSDVNISKGTTYYTKILDKSTNIESDILNCGTGYQSMIILSILEAYVKLAQKRTEYILIIEEPEVYLHPSLQRKMIDTLLMISLNNQVVFSSHSPITVGKMERHQIKLVKRESGEAKLFDITVSEVIEELGIRADDILVNKGIVFVEGKDDKAVIECILNKIHPGASDEINILVTGNCENLKFFANAELLINNKFDVPFLIIRDSDGMSVEERKNGLLNDIIKFGRDLSEEQIEKIKKSIFIVSKYSVEGYFIDEMFLKHTGIDCELLRETIKCYECQYNHFYSVAKSDKDRQAIANWYQPKHLLENFEDKFKASEEDAREKHKKRYETKWKEFKKCEACDGDVNKFFKGRNEINKFTHKKKLSKEEYLVQIVGGYSVDELKISEIKDLIFELENMCNTIYAK
ncbi:ATP-binding protein [Lachnoclostridium pacaense]|uniref:AAA family ATPase n=1 Tax=Enterocloster hominis (ex Hitch et al. 2024) TaxID=1917870 RepID=UPI001D10C6AE|nr:AAA family ATPase [Lachnoclostridium pacaense]MCC2877499.1 ATP-binding protein [Lachnoclostridium pacaense]